MESKPDPARSTTSPTLGILGGMGPLASAELLATLYRHNTPEPEQGAPACLLLSDPAFPDRTTAILAGATAPLVERLTGALAKLAEMGADRIVIACVTIHHLLPEVPETLRRRVISLIDLAIDEIRADPRPHLLLATIGTRRARIFESHPRWPEVEALVRWPGEADQQGLHDRLYQLKRHTPPAAVLPWLDALAERSGDAGLIFGCTELHLLQRALAARAAAEDGGAGGNGSPAGARRIVDPLLIVARELPRLLATAPGFRAAG
jgi:aspartate racemase